MAYFVPERAVEADERRNLAEKSSVP